MTSNQTNGPPQHPPPAGRGRSEGDPDHPQPELLQRDDRESLLSESQQSILDWIRAREDLYFSRKDATENFALPARTIEAAVKRVLEYKFIERLGAGRATRYRLLK